MSNKNPALELTKLIQAISVSCNPIMGCRGRIVQSPPDIVIAYNDSFLYREDVWIAHHLLIGYERQARGHIVSGTLTACSHCGHSHVIDNDYIASIIYTDTLEPGDYVALIPIKDTKQYFVMQKVVKP